MNNSSARKILGVDSSADKEVIKKAYRSLAMKWHPDREGGDEKKFKEIKEAFEYLEKYGESPYSSGGNAFNDSYKDDFLEKLRKAMAAQAGAGKYNEPPINPFTGKPYNEGKSYDYYTYDGDGYPQEPKQSIFKATIDITLEEAFKGVTKNVNMPGKGMFPIAIPAGVSEDDCIRTIETGNETFRVFVAIRMLDNEKIDWGRNDLSCKGNITRDVKVPALRMILGGWLDVTTIDGAEVQVRIPKGLEANKLLKVKDRGYWKNKDRCLERGDLFLRIIPLIQTVEDTPVSLYNEFINTVDTVRKEKESK